MSALVQSRKKRIVLAAAESTIRFKLLTHLNKAGFEVELASNAPIALKKLTESHSDALLIDSALPEMKGDDLVQQARQLDGVDPKPIFVFVTAGSFDPWKKRASKKVINQAFDKDTSPEFVVTEIVGQLGYANLKPVVARPVAPTAQRKAVVPELSDDIKGFEISWQKPKQAGKPAPAPAARPSGARMEPTPIEDDGAEGDNGPARNKYWQAKVQELGVENMKLQETIANLTRERDHLTVVLRSEGGEQLQRVRAEAEAAVGARDAATTRADQLQAELSQVRMLHDKVNARVGEEARVVGETKRHNEFLEQQIAKNNIELSRLRGELENRVAESGSVEADLTKQLSEARLAAQSAETTCRVEAEKAARFQAELARLLQARAELNGKFTETQLQNERLTKEIERLRAEHTATEAELRQQLEAARAAALNAQNAISEETAVFSRSRDKLLALQRENDDLLTRFNTEQRAAVSYKRQVEKLEEQLRDSSVQGARLKSELEALRSATERSEAGSKEEMARAFRLETEVNSLRQRTQELERNRNAAVRELERVKGELSSGVREQLQAAQGAAAEAQEELLIVQRAKDDLAGRVTGAEQTAECAQSAYMRETARAEKLEKELIGLRKARAQLSERLKDEQNEAEKFKRRVKDLAEDLDRAKAELELQMATRKRLKETGALPAELSAVDQRVRSSVSALSRATADLEKERKRLEDVASRRDPADSARIGKAFIKSFRKQLRAPADNLLHSIRRLVNLSVEEEHKRLAEAALENAVVLQTRLAEEPIVSSDIKS